MPKARNHPHHHSSTERKARASGAGGLQLPQWRWDFRAPYLQNPLGWKTRLPTETIFGTSLGCQLLAVLAALLIVGLVVVVLLAQVGR